MVRGATIFHMPRKDGLIVGDWCLIHKNPVTTQIGRAIFTDGISGPVSARDVARMLATSSDVRALPISDEAEVAIVAPLAPDSLRHLVLDCCEVHASAEALARAIEQAKAGRPIGLRAGRLLDTPQPASEPAEPLSDPAPPMAVEGADSMDSAPAVETPSEVPATLEGLNVNDEIMPLLARTSRVATVEMWLKAEKSAEKPRSTVVKRIESRLRALRG